MDLKKLNQSQSDKMTRNLSEKNRKKAIKNNETHFHGLCWCEKESKTLNIEGWCFECAIDEAERTEKKQDIRETDDVAHFNSEIERCGITDEWQKKEIWENNYRFK